MNISEKRKEAFLTGRARLSCFTKEAAIKFYDVSSEEFEGLITKHLIEPFEEIICESCFRPMIENQDKEDGCFYCGHEDFATLSDLYRYVDKKRGVVLDGNLQ